MFRRLSLSIHFALILALLAGSGAQWLVLQSAAWTSMFVSFAQELPFSEALVKTFDGSSPCSVCEKIAEAPKEAPQKDQNHSPTPGWHGILPASLTLSAPDWIPLTYPRASLAAGLRSETPLSPPPRA